MGFWSRLLGRETARPQGGGTTTRTRPPRLSNDSRPRSAAPVVGADATGLVDLPMVVEVHQSVVGESHYQPALRRAAGGREARMTGDNWEDAIEVVARLVPEPTNPYDVHAVRVQVDGQIVGYLASEITAGYQPALLRLRDSGRVASCEGRITGGGSRSYGIFVKISLPATVDILATLRPHIRPLFGLSGVTVTGEQDHQDVLAAVDGQPSERRHLVTLHSAIVSTGKYKGGYTVDVRLNDLQVGCLIAAMGERYRGVVTSAEQAGQVAGCSALICQDVKRGRQVELFLPHARELPQVPVAETGGGR